MNFIDTHCHLYLPEFDADRDAMIRQAQDASIIKFFLPNIDATSIDSMLALVNLYPQACFPMMGLHPCSVKEDWEKQIATIESYLFEKSDLKFWGIGETGLDYYWDKTFVSKQKENFQLHIDWAKKSQLPIIIHSRDAIDDCIELIQKNKDENLRGIFHCFSGNLEQAQKIIALDFYLGIGGVLTFKNSGLDKVMEAIDLSQVVLETDAPYLAPVPYRGKRNESSYLKLVAEKLAAIKKMSLEDIAEITTKNASKLFGITN